MSDDKLKSIVDRIENLEAERAAIGGDIRDVYSEAKSLKYSVKALRKVVAERRQKDRSELDAEMERIRAALGSNSYREAAKQLGISKSKLQRLVPKHASGTDHDPTTAEITPPSSGGEGCAETGSAIRDGDGLSDALSPIAEPVGRSDGCSTEEDTCLSGRDAPSDDISSTGFEAGNQAHEGEDYEQRNQLRPFLQGHDQGGGERGAGGDAETIGRAYEDVERAKTGAVGSPEGDRVASAEIDIGIPDADDLEIPQFLRRTEARRAGT